MSLPPHRPQLLAFDLDGTLILEASLTVPEATISALARLRRLGVQAAIVTGRDQPPPGVLAAAQPVAVATSNGGQIEIGGQLHTELRFSEAELAAVLGHQLGNARVIAFTSRAIYVDLPPGVWPRPSGWPAASIFRSARPRRARSSRWAFTTPEVASWRDELRGGGFGHLVFTGAQPPYPEFLTVTPSGADKGAALSVIAEQLGVPMERVTAFGDSDNDEAMLALAGRAVQVGHLPLLAPYAHEQVERPEVLGAYLHALADELEADGSARAPLELRPAEQDK